MIFLFFMVGCSNKNAGLHPAFKLKPKDVEAAKVRGMRALKSGADPYSIYKWTTKSVNMRVSTEVIIRDAAMCLPKDEIAFAIVKAGDSSEQGINRVVNEAVLRTSKEVKFSLVLQISENKDPKSVQFEMRTNTGQKYPPLVVEAPLFIREVTSALDPTIPPGAMYGYNVHFPVQGNPGYPPLHGGVRELTVVIIDDTLEGSVSFTLGQASTPW